MSEQEHRLSDLERELTLLSRHFIAARGPRIGQSLERSAYVLLTRLEVGDPLTLKELAHTFQVDVSTINRQVSAMLRNGLVERFPDPEGGMARKFRPTALGLERLEADRAISRAGTTRLIEASGWTGSAPSSSSPCWWSSTRASNSSKVSPGPARAEPTPPRPRRTDRYSTPGPFRWGRSPACGRPRNSPTNTRGGLAYCWPHGTEPGPVHFDAGSGPTVHQSTDRYVYDGTPGVPVATEMRGACSCSRRGTPAPRSAGRP